jgi:predicted  nucleic acid-binding Zn-ribbon protein
METLNEYNLNLHHEQHEQAFDLRIHPYPSIIIYMSQTLNLYRLQLVDSRCDQALARIAEIDRIMSEDQALIEAQKLYQNAEQALKQARFILTTAEDAVQAQQIKIEQSTSSLYSGRIQNPKELQDLQNELATLKRYLARLEDQQLEAMISLEKFEDEFAQAQKTLQKEQARALNSNSVLAGEQFSLRKELDRLDIERTAVISSVTPDGQKLYDRLRQQKRGLAVSTIHDDSCDACGSTLTPAELQIARSTNQISLCPTCGRILYAG